MYAVTYIYNDGHIVHVECFSIAQVNLVVDQGLDDPDMRYVRVLELS